MTLFKPAVRQFFKSTLKAHPGIIAAMAVMAVVNAFFEGVGMSMLLPIIEGLHDPSGYTPVHPLSQKLAAFLSWFSIPFSLWVLFLICISLFFFQALAKYVRAVLAAKMGSHILTDSRERLFKALMSSRLAYVQQRKLGDLVNSFITDADWARAAFQQFFNTIVEGLLACTYVFVVTAISWQLSLIVLGFMALLAVVGKKRKVIYVHGTKLGEATDRLGSTVTECMTGFREIKLFGRDEHVEASFSKVSAKVSDTMYAMLKATAVFGMVYDLAGVVLLFGVVGFGWAFLGMTGAEIVVFLGILFRLVPRVNSCQSAADCYAGTVVGVEGMSKIIDEIQGKKETSAPGKLEPVFRSHLELRDVSFQYEGGNQPSLTNLNLRLERGKTLAVIGSSGAGKSTLVDLVARFHDPSAGSILVDGVDLKDLDLKQWRGMIGFVSQENFLFNDTIANNIRFGTPEATDDEVTSACKAVHAHEFISQMPEGYATIVGDRGVRLSGGQRQRLSLARAVLRDPKILILDEATSDLDSKSEHLIEQSLADLRKNRTLIVIAHRLATVEKADEIIVLQSGVIVERGTHKELLKSGHHYSEFYHLQFRKTANQDIPVAAVAN